MAIINDWESSRTFDNELSKIEHYRKNHHPEMMPFIGSHYNKTGILLVGESHFYEYDKNNNQQSEKEYLEERWYKEPTPEVFSYKDNFNTRKVIHNFLIRKRTKAHSMFKNPAQCVIEVYDLDHISDSEVFNAFAFMNYFQKPALEAHKSIDNDNDDTQFAYNTFISVCNVIKPKRVVFLSKKAYEYYIKCCDKSILSVPVDFVYHPTCSYWNQKDGKEKFKKIINQSKESISFSKYRYYSKNEIIKFLPDNFNIIKSRQRRFIKDKITIRMYENSEGVYEFAAHILANNIKVGVGYNVENQCIWIWNYNENEYISISDIEKYRGLNALYSSFYKIIENL